MSNTREEPDYETRETAMKHAVHLVAETNRGTNSGSFKQPGNAAVAIADVIADYLTNGKAKETE